MDKNQPQGEQPESSDLGFGSVIARESRRRLLNADGSFNVERDGIRFWQRMSLYHALLTMSWPKFFLTLGAIYLGLNAFFAELYLLCGPHALTGRVPHSNLEGIERAFFFSVQTLSTVGYGGIAPNTTMANVVMTLETLTALMVLALGSGLAFARFSRPVARVIFSENAIIAPYRGGTAFEFRITNGRESQLIELDATVVYSRFEDGASGPLRRFYRLELERSHVTFFPLSWTIVHPIDERSPLFGMTEDKLRDQSGEFLVLLTGIDETFSQTVHARSSYLASEIKWDVSFVDIFERGRDGDPLRINVAKLGAVSNVVNVASNHDLHVDHVGAGSTGD